MNNVISFHHETRIMNDAVLWRNAKCLSDEELFDEYRALKIEARRRKNNSSIH